MAAALKTIVAKGDLQPCCNYRSCNCRNHAATIENIGATNVQPSQHCACNCRNRSLRDWPLVAGQPRQRYGRLMAPSLVAILASQAEHPDPGLKRCLRGVRKALDCSCVCLPSLPSDDASRRARVHVVRAAVALRPNVDLQAADFVRGGTDLRIRKHCKSAGFVTNRVVGHGLAGRVTPPPGPARSSSRPRPASAPFRGSQGRRKGIERPLFDPDICPAEQRDFRTCRGTCARGQIGARLSTRQWTYFSSSKDRG